jgi:hypothetical protein
MHINNESWMEMHRLATSIDELGLTRQERFDFLLAEFAALPPLVRRELLRELRFLICELTDIEPLALNVDAVQPPPVRRAGKTA